MRPKQMAEDPVFWDDGTIHLLHSMKNPTGSQAVLQPCLLILNPKCEAKARTQLRLLCIGIIKLQAWWERQGEEYFFLSCQPVLYIHQDMLRRKDK